jgi:hypothetical protein
LRAAKGRRIYHWADALLFCNINPSLGTIRWEPSADQLGTFPVKVRVSDPYGGTDTQAFSIAVRGTNSPPVIKRRACDRCAESLRKPAETQSRSPSRCTENSRRLRCQ